MSLLSNDLCARLIAFRDERDWKQFHTPETWPHPSQSKRANCWKAFSGPGTTNWTPSFHAIGYPSKMKSPTC